MTTYKKKTYKKKPSTSRVVKKAVYKAKRQVLVKTIKSVIKRQVETKVNNFAAGFEIATGGIGSNNIQPMTPYNVLGCDIQQGTGQGDRIGNRISTKSLIMRYTILPLPYNVTSNPTPKPQLVRMWFFSQKSSNTLLATNPPNFIQNGDYSTTLSGDLLDMNRVINNDVYNYLGHRTFKVGYQNSAGTGNTPGSQYFANNDFKMFAQGSINLTKMIPKVIKYNDGDDNPNSKLVMMLIQCVNADGSGADPDRDMIRYNYQLTYKYTDA